MQYRLYTMLGSQHKYVKIYGTRVWEVHIKYKPAILLTFDKIWKQFVDETYGREVG